VSINERFRGFWVSYARELDFYAALTRARDAYITYPKETLEHRLVDLNISHVPMDDLRCAF